MISENTYRFAADWTPQLLVAAFVTIKMAVLAYILAAVLGLIVALGCRSNFKPLATACKLYIEFIRGTPMLTQLFLIYFGLVELNIILAGFSSAVIALGLHYAAYIAEVYRAGILTIDHGQHEAAYAVGMTRGETMRYIIMPQSIRVILPPMTNMAVSLLKDTSICSLIAAPELMLRANDLSSQYFMPMQLFLIAGGMYLVMAYPLSHFARCLERRVTNRRVGRTL